MQLDDAESIETARVLATTIPGGVHVVLCPPFTALHEVASALTDGRDGIALGAQDCSWEERGALTGEVSPADLRALGCTYVIVGHSERRQELGETSAMAARKVRAALRAGLVPICCIGETFDERQAGKQTAVLTEQLTAVLEGLDLSGSQSIVLAYEPVWAIGTGHAATPSDIAEAVSCMMATCTATLDAESVQRVRIVYGGSVDPTNVRALLAVPHISGFLVGTASQTAARFRNLIAAARA